MKEEKKKFDKTNKKINDDHSKIIKLKLFSIRLTVGTDDPLWNISKLLSCQFEERIKFGRILLNVMSRNCIYFDLFIVLCFQYCIMCLLNVPCTDAYD